MAGFLGFGNYSKPGPGVSKDAPEKKGLFLFFELYFRKFWKLLQSNLLFIVCCIPFVIPFLLATYFASTNGLVVLLSLLPLIGIAPLISGLTFILRNYTRQQNAFIWMDFRDTVKNNWKQSLAIGLLDFVAYYLIIISLNFYHAQMAKSPLIVIPFIISILVTILFTWMQYYLFVMVVTFDLSVVQILRNALIFSIAGLGRNILITIILGLIALLCYISPLALILLPIIGISTAGFVIVFNVWPTIKKFMIPEGTEDNKTSEEQVFEDAEPKKSDDNK